MAEIQLRTDEWAQPEDMSGSDFETPPLGRWHCVVADVSERKEGECEIWFDIVTPGEHKGKRLTQKLKYPDGRDAEKDKTYLKRLGAWFFRMGVITTEKWDAHKENGQTLTFDTADATGRQCIVEVIPHSYISKKTGKTIDTAQIGYMGVFPLTHADVQTVEIDPAIAALDGYVRLPGGGASPFAIVPPKEPAPVPVGETVPDDQFDI